MKDICPHCGERTAVHDCRRLWHPIRTGFQKTAYMFLRKIEDAETILSRPEDFRDVRTSYWVCLECGDLHMHYDHRSSDYDDWEAWLKPGEEQAPRKWLKFSLDDAEKLRPRAQEIFVLARLGT